MRPLLFIPLLFVAACGFRPVYGTQYQAERTQATASLAEVAVVTSTSRLGQLLGEELRDALNPEHIPAVKRYRLQVQVSERNIPLFVAPDGTYGRGNVRYTARYTLTRLSDGKQVDSGSVTREASYAASEINAIYGSYVAQQDARTRGVIELAHDVSMRVSNRLDRDSLEEETPEGAEPDPLLEDDPAALSTLGVE